MKKVRSVCFLLSVIVSLVFFAKSNEMAGSDVPCKNDYLPEFSDYTYDVDDTGTTHIARLREYDNEMNVIGYLNSDGTKSVYIFDSDVKFINEDGFVIEKNTKIVRNEDVPGFKYAQEANNIQTYFTDGSSQLEYMICYGEYKLTVVPSGGEVKKGKYDTLIKNAGKGIEAENTITYCGVYGDETFVRYTAGISGVKEEIVYNKPTNVESFHFIIYTGELSAELRNRSVFLTDSNGETIFILPGIAIYDSSKEGRKYSFDSKIRLNRIEKGQYELIIIPDSQFMNSENTAYPVYIDPTVTVSNSQDAAVYSAASKAWNTFGYDSINMVGYSSENGFGYFYTKANLSAINSVRYDNIISASYCIRELSGTVNAGVIEAYMVSESWTEGSITWNNKPANLSQKLTACKVQYGESAYSDNNWYSFYVTQACMGWNQGLDNYGIVLKPQDANVYKAFAAREYTSGYTPYWKITYIDEDEVISGLGVEFAQFYIKNKETKKYLTKSGSSVYTASFSGGTEQKWLLTPVAASYWKICPNTYTTQALGVSVSDGSGHGITIGYYTSSSLQMWKITRNWNGTYRIQSKASLDNGHTYSITENNSQLAIYSYVFDYDFDQDWTLEPVDLGVADFYTQVSPIADSVLEYAENAGFSAYEYHLPYTSNDLSQWIVSDRLVVTESHGAPGCIQIGDEDFRPYTYFSGIKPSSPGFNSVYVSDYEPNELKHLTCLVYNACSAGATDYSTNSNLVGITYKRGAHFAAAWTIEIWGSSFTNDFMMQINNGGSIYEAMEYAAQSNQAHNGLWNYHYLGDTDIVFNHVF